MNKKYTIEDMLNALSPTFKSNGNKLSAKEIWQMIGAREALEKMGFNSEEELTQFIKDEPYKNL
jgi:hypothetical protein